MFPHVLGKGPIRITAKESMGHLKAQKDRRKTSFLTWATDYQKEANSHQGKRKDIVFYLWKVVDCIVGKCLLGQFHLENLHRPVKKTLWAKGSFLLDMEITWILKVVLLMRLLPTHSYIVQGS